MEDMTARKMNQLHDGSLGRLESHDFGILVYSRAESFRILEAPCSSQHPERFGSWFGKKFSAAGIRSNGRRGTD